MRDLRLKGNIEFQMLPVLETTQLTKDQHSVNQLALPITQVAVNNFYCQKVTSRPSTVIVH
jgi:hypothetical protein